MLRHRHKWLRWEFDAKFSEDCPSEDPYPDIEKNTENIESSAEDVIRSLNNRLDDLRNKLLEFQKQKEKKRFWKFLVGLSFLKVLMMFW